MQRAGADTGTTMGALSGRFGSLATVARRLIGPLGGVFAVFTLVRQVREAVRVFAEFEESMRFVQAVSGASADQLRVLEQTARDLGATTRFSASEAAQGLLELARAGLTVEQQVAAIPGVLDLAMISNLSLANSSLIVVRALAQFQLTAAESGRVVDVLTAASNSSAVTVEQLAASLRMAGSVANSVGLDFEDAAGFLAVLADNALVGARGGTTLRGVISALIRPTKQAMDVFEAKGIALEDIDLRTRSLIEVMETLQEAQLDTRDTTIVFGRQMAAGALALMNNTEEVRRLTAEFRESEGAAEEFANTVSDSLAAKFRELRSATQELFLTIGDSGLGHAVRFLVEGFTDIIRALSGAQAEFQGFNDVVDGTRAFLEAVIDGLGDLWTVLDPFVSDAVDLTMRGFNTVVEGWRNIGLMLIAGTRAIAEAMGGDFGRATGIIIGLFQTIGQTGQQIFNALVRHLDAMVTSVQLLIDRQFDQARQLAANSVTLFNRQMEAAFGGFNERLEANVNRNVELGQRFGEDFAKRFQEGFTSIMEGDFVFADRVRAAFARVRERRSARDLARAERDRAAGTEVVRGGMIEEEDLDPLEAAREAEEQARTAARRATEDMRRQLQLQTDMIGKNADARERAALMAEFHTAAEEAFGAQLEENDPMVKEFNDQITRMQRLRQLETAFQDFGQAAGDAMAKLADGSMNAKEAFHSFMEELRRVAIQRATMALINAILFGGAGGGGGAFGAVAGAFAGGGAGGPEGFAEGGRPPTGRVSIVGERGPELFIPDTAGRIVSAGAFGSVGGGSAPIALTIVNVTDPDEALNELDSANGERVVMNVIRKNREVVRREIAG